MADSSREIKRRMASVKNTGQITKAMEMVSAAKMRKSQEAALKARPYALAALDLLANLGSKIKSEKYLLLRKREIKKVLLILITTDRGLCGGLNFNLLKAVLKYIKKREEEGKTIDLITVGKKGIDLAKRLDYRITAEFINYGDLVDLLKITPAAKLAVEEYKKGNYDQTVIAYTNFISTLKQEPAIRQILPLNKTIIETIVGEIIPQRGRYAEEKREEKKESLYNYEYLFEPSPEKVLESLLSKLIEIQVYNAVLEANASEHSARMVAMKNASENAWEMLNDLRLSYNKARQAGITKEISEISAGRAALEE